MQAYMKNSLNNKPSKQISPETRKRVALLVINTLVLVFIYFGSQNMGQPVLSMIITAAYWLILAVFGVIYFAYNRAFSRKNLTHDMLPSEWTYEQKEDFINDGKSRLEKSKWMLSVIIPFMITVLLDAVYLFTWPMVQNLFNL